MKSKLISTLKYLFTERYSLFDIVVLTLVMQLAFTINLWFLLLFFLAAIVSAYASEKLSINYYENKQKA